MKRHFPKPSELMPEAWFMGWEINFFSWLSDTPPDTLERRVLADAMQEIAGGLIDFPETKYVKTWRDWFKYLLPYAIENIHQESESGYRSVLLATLTAVICVYPQKIDEEYDNFRQDVIFALGTQIFPAIASPDELEFDYISTLLYISPEEQPRLYDDFSLPMLFALRYLEPSEIVSWVISILAIQNYAWRFGILCWWLALNTFLDSARNWPKDSELESLLGGLVEAFWITHTPFLSLEAVIPVAHLAAFQEALTQHLTSEVLQSWVADIKAHQTFTYEDQIIALPERALDVIGRILANFEQRFFAS